MPTRIHNDPFNHAGGDMQIEVIGSGTAQLEVESKDGVWTKVGDKLNKGAHTHKLMGAIYRFDLVSAEVVTRHEFTDVSWRL